MSLGWLTESGLMPKESKKIKVDSNSIVGLKAKILEHKTKLESQVTRNNLQAGKKIKREEKAELKLNHKIKQIGLKLGHTETMQITESLEQKAKIYQNLKGEREFTQEKGEDKDQYVIDFELSYIRKNQEESKEERHMSQMGASARQQERERVQWEERARKEIKEAEEREDGLGEAVIARSRPQVRQCWDNVLSAIEKSHLPQVIAERKQYKKMKEAAKQKKASNLQKRKKLIERLKNADNQIK